MALFIYDTYLLSNIGKTSIVLQLSLRDPTQKQLRKIWKDRGTFLLIMYI